MPATLKSTVTELPESRVRLQVEVASSELERRVERKAKELGGSLRVPGFRRGKVPAPLVIQRVGRLAVLEEAVRDSLPSWYAAAVEDSRIVPVGDPEIDLGELPDRGQALQFSIEIGVLPVAKLGDYKGLEVPRGEPAVQDEEVDKEIEGLRERLARLETYDGAAGVGDFVVIDYEGALVDSETSAAPEGSPSDPKTQLSASDQLLELGAGSVTPEIEQALLGGSAGESKQVTVAFAPDYQEATLAGRSATLQILVKEVKRKELPALDDDLAIDAGFDTLDELRADVRERLKQAAQRRVDSEFREAALDAAVAAAEVQTPPALVQARAREMWERMIHSLGHRGISREAYLKIDGRGEDQILAELEPDAERALRREAVITAIVAAEGIERDEQAVEQALSTTAAERKKEPSELVAELRAAGRLEEVREELQARAAIDLLAEHATPIAPELAQARERIWTPESEGKEHAAEPGGEEQRPGEAGKLWTPGS